MSSDDPTRRLEQFRHRTLRELEYQRSAGRLAQDEFDRRAAQARTAASPLDLRHLIEDLALRASGDTLPAVPAAPSTPAPPHPPPAMAVGSVPEASTGRRQTHATRSEGDSDFALALMSGSIRDGDWEPPPTVNALALMGGVKLDFREASFPDETVRVHAYAIMGGINIIVPPDVHVTVRGIGLMGGFNRVRRTSPGPDAPRIKIDGFALMGGVDVKVREVDDDDED